MADLSPKSVAAFTADEEEEIQDENTSKDTAEGSKKTKQQRATDQGLGLSIEQEEGDKRVSSLAREGILPEKSNTILRPHDAGLERPRLSSGAVMDTYEEITKSELASLDDWENVHKSCLSEIPPVDPEVLHDLELRANGIAGNLDHMLATLGNSLKAMSQVSSECLGTYGSCVDHVSEAVDENIKSMYTLIARCEELNASLKPLQNLAEQVKEIKRTLDIFEAICK